LEHPKTLQTMAQFVKDMSSTMTVARGSRAAVEGKRYCIKFGVACLATVPGRNANEHENSTSNQLLGLPRAFDMPRVRSTGGIVAGTTQGCQAKITDIIIASMSREAGATDVRSGPGIDGKHVISQEATSKPVCPSPKYEQFNMMQS
jgi:hypothetical protein